jgi:hypothetical protein
MKVLSLNLIKVLSMIFLRISRMFLMILLGIFSSAKLLVSHTK